MFKSVGVLAALPALCLAACTVSPPSPQSLVSVNNVLNSVTCGIAQAAASPEGVRLVGQEVTISLSLQVVTDTSAGLGVNTSGGGSGGGGSSKGGSSGKGGSSAKVVSAGSSLFPALNFGAGQTWTSTHKTGYKIQRMPKREEWFVGEGKALLETCARYLPEGAAHTDPFAFHRWMSDNLKSLAAMIAIGDGKPWSSIDTKFAVSTSAGASIQVPTIIPLGANASLSKNDVQQLTVVVGTVPRGSGPGDGSSRESVGIPLSLAVPTLKAVRPTNLRLLPFD